MRVHILVYLHGQHLQREGCDCVRTAWQRLQADKKANMPLLARVNAGGQYVAWVTGPYLPSVKADMRGAHSGVRASGQDVLGE